LAEAVNPEEVETLVTSLNASDLKPEVILSRDAPWKALVGVEKREKLVDLFFSALEAADIRTRMDCVEPKISQQSRSNRINEVISHRPGGSFAGC
jgi:hypothetical protein